MTDTEVQADEVDLSAEEEPAPAAPPAEEGVLASAGGVPDNWAASAAAMHQPAMSHAPAEPAPMGPAPDPRPEKSRFLIRLGNLFCGGPNG